MTSQFWDERYRAPEYVYGQKPNDFLRAQAHRIPPGKVLCLAEGEGRNAAFLASLGYAVTAVDFSAEGVRKTEALARRRRVEVTAIRADLATYQAEPDAYAGIVAIFAHMQPEIRQHVHAWIPRALEPGGVFILEAYTPDQLQFNTGGPRDAAFLMTLAQLRQELAPLAFEIGRELQRHIEEGVFHGGPSATVQVAAVRA